jgi:BTB/POZ domain-containing protein KCTD9
LTVAHRIEMSEDGESQELSAPSADKHKITLQVGEQRFVTTRETLVGESVFFASLLSGRWDNMEEDGSYFIDADGGLFEHILRYLRRGVFPLFYDKTTGHNFHLYLALLEEVRYFGISLLQEWLEEKKYLGAVKIKYSVTEVDEIKDLQMVERTDKDLEFHLKWHVDKVYICPRMIYVHRGDPNRCGKDCRRAKGDDDDEYEDELVLKGAVVTKHTEYDPRTCLAGRVNL